MKLVNPTTILEFLFNSERPNERNKHQTPHDPGPKGPTNFPYNSEAGETMDEEEIDAELSELKLGPTMSDPTNLTNHNVHDGSFSWGKGSKPFGNFKTKSRLSDPSGQDTMVKTIAIEDGESLGNSDDENPLELELENEVFITYPKIPLPKVQIWNEALPEDTAPLKITDKLTLADILTGMHDPEKEEIVRKKLAMEEVGAREKALHHGDSMMQTTKQPFASGMPKATDMNFMSDDEIMQELGLSEDYKTVSLFEWISSSSVFNKRMSGPNDEENFFDDESKNFVMNSEEDFNENQRKRNKIKNGKKK